MPSPHLHFMTNFHVEASTWEDSVSLGLACCGDCLFRVQEGNQHDPPAQKTYANVQVQSNPNNKGGHPSWLTCQHFLQLSQDAQEQDSQALKLLPSFLDALISYRSSLPAAPCSGPQDTAFGLLTDMSLSSGNGHHALCCLPICRHEILPTSNTSPQSEFR